MIRVGIAVRPEKIRLLKDAPSEDLVSLRGRVSEVAYYGDTPLRIEPEGGDFAAGKVRLAIHCLEISPPNLV